MKIVKSVIKGEFKIATQVVEVNKTLSEPIKLTKVLYRLWIYFLQIDEYWRLME